MKKIINTLLKEEKPLDLIGLYTFYCNVSEKQESHTIKCPISYTAKELKATEERIRKAKKKLIELGLISNIKKRNDNGQIIDWYIKICKTKTVN